MRFALVLNNISSICEKCKYDPLEMSGAHFSDSSICVRQNTKKPRAHLLEFKNHSHPLTTLWHFYKCLLDDKASISYSQMGEAIFYVSASKGNIIISGIWKECWWFQFSSSSSHRHHAHPSPLSDAVLNCSVPMGKPANQSGPITCLGSISHPVNLSHWLSHWLNLRIIWEILFKIQIL